MRRRRRFPTIVVLLVLAAGLAGCGGGGSDEGQQDDPGESQDEDIRRVSFVPPGPSDDATPRGNQWYVFLSEGRCQALLDDANRAPANDPPVIIYRAAAEACTGRHAEAARDLERYLALGIPTSQADCGRVFVIEFVQDVLNAVRADPAAAITFVESERRPPCQEDETATTAGRRAPATTAGRAPATTAGRAPATTAGRSPTTTARRPTTTGADPTP